MDPDLRLRSKSVDPGLIGRRVREARIRAGLTQGELAAEDASTAYISRIESGNRRPSPELLVAIAGRLATTPDELLADEAGADVVSEEAARLRLELDYADLALRTGQTEQALAGASSVLASATEPELMREARYLLAGAHEASGDYDAAIRALELLARDDDDGLAWIRTMLALSRCYRESGDLARACDVGDRVGERIEDLGLAGSAEAVRLSVTVAAAHFERGDVNHAVRMCLRALELAEGLDSPEARAAAYWNSSMMEKNRGKVAAALPLAQRAIALLESTEDARNLARLRGEIGVMQLRQDPPQASDARLNLEQALSDLEWTSASPTDVARNQLALAEATFLTGDVDDANALVRSAISGAAHGSLVHASALVLQGQLHAAADDPAAAVASFRTAILMLSGIGADRGAAQLWFELAALLETHGMVAEALDAYRRAAASSGLTRPTSLVAPQQRQTV